HPANPDRRRHDPRPHLTEMGSAQAPAFRYGVSASTDRQAWYTVNYERQGSEAGIQVPLLPDPRAGRSSGPHIRVRQVCLQPGARRTVTSLDSRAAPSHSIGHHQNAHQLETRPRNRVAYRAIQGAITGCTASPAGRFQQVLDQANRLSEVQEEGENPGLGNVLPQLLHLPQWTDQAGEAVGATQYPMVSPTARRGGPVECDRVPGLCGPLPYLDP